MIEQEAEIVRESTHKLAAELGEDGVRLLIATLQIWLAERAERREGGA